MPNLLQKRWYGYQTAWAFMLQLLLVIFISYSNWILGLVSLCLVCALAYAMLRTERKFRKELEQYISELTFRVKRVEGEAISRLPFGVLLYADNRTVEWHNRFVTGMFGRGSTVIGQPLSELLPMVPQFSRDKKENEGRTTLEVVVNDRNYELTIQNDERMIYVQDMTELASLRDRYEDERMSFGIIMLDNLDEASQGMDDQQRAALIARVASVLTAWAKQYRVYLRRLSSERYLMMLNQKSLKDLELSRFVVLDEVRELTADLKVPMTLSIGLAFGPSSVSELGELAQSSLDMALGRGGDQAAVKSGQRLSFYGGKTTAVEKRTRVRARVIAHALRDLMQESDRVIIMGHRVPDLDVLGASIGVLKAADMYKVEAYIVLDGSNPAIERMMERIDKDEPLRRRFISPDQAMSLMTENTLLIVVDTHKKSMTMEPALVDQARRVVIVDHHRRGEEFINDAVLVYLEPYASSACELVTELLQYIHEKVQLSPLEATALLSGITVDTKHFALHTGSRTFEAAGFLRRNGADTVVVQRILKEDLQEYIEKAEIIKHARMIHGHIALAVTESNRKIPQLLIAQVADTLLNMTNVLASFVISARPDGMIGISARSLGTMNVQVVMEKLGGGGHLTNAAAQLEGTQADAERKLLEVLDEIEREEGLFE
ncbi:c-di-AMP phosphodiesterase-like protein [Paenibacillus shirakamiensis]|uniref:Cyclic-di-AMP phosphodiesterase n=1 Tax=Paenibacillus shirakamiensis TaxID=1265935 RepID=A0ABS4JKT3_9BACL|nr:DHH family phosphoesterase [Paenibacillus shirakamiensis]MBP2002328.1 c-di-AMP phosphodiesterase-like protein [Paenibacillus shirakamiensis]